MSIATPEKKQWNLVATAMTVPRPIATVCAFFGLLALAGYLGHIESLYRPIANGPATHPLTAVNILLLGLCIRASSRTHYSNWLVRILLLLSICTTLARLTDALFHLELTRWMTPFYKTVILDHFTGKSNAMGINTSIMLFSIAIALGLKSWQMPRASQITASISIAIPTVSFTGYAYGLEHFHGQMSLLTASAGFGLAAATLALTSDRAGLKAVLSPYIGGRLARAQVLAGYMIPTALGYLLVKSVISVPNQDHSLFGIFVVTICWFIILMVSISAVFHEKSDFARRLNEAKLADAAQTDSLTGLPNRRQFFEFGIREIERIKRSGNELWVLMIDLDHFKNINDTAGHGVGDQVLIAIAEVLSHSIRKIDVIGRLGGEEFAILLTDTHREGCERVSENIRRNVELLSIPDWTDIHGAVTTSIGCAKLTQTDTLDSALHAADEALYLAKHGGRNRVSFVADI